MKGHVSKYELKSGATRWRLVYDLPPDADTGDRRQVTRRGFETKGEADRALREALSLVDSGVAANPSGSTTLADYMRRWLAGIRVRPTTMSDYRRNVERYTIPRIGSVRLKALEPEHLDRLYRELETSGKADGSGLSPKTVRNVHGTIHKALQDAAERGHVLRNVATLANPPAAKDTRSFSARDKAWTREQLRAFLDSCRDHHTWPFWRLIAATGLRRGEAIGLAWSAVDLEEQTLSVRQTITQTDGKIVWAKLAKTDAGNRTISLDAATVDVLREVRRAQVEARLAAGPAWRGDPAPDEPDWADVDLVFTDDLGLRLLPTKTSSRFTRLARAAKLPGIGVHGLRHTYATAAIRAGVAPDIVAARLGHADVATTLRLYSHVLEGDDQRAADRVAAAIFGA